MQVWLAFADRARIDPSMGEVWARVWEGQRSLCRIVVAGLDGARQTASSPTSPWCRGTRLSPNSCTPCSTAWRSKRWPTRGHMRPTTLRRVLHDHLRAVSEQLGG